MFRRKAIALLSAGLMSVALIGCGAKTDSSSNMSDSSMNSSAPGNIIQVATGPGMEQVTTLVKAVQAAGLVDTLQGPGPFTVFAPTNDAFAKLPPGTLDDLLKPENKDKLRSILLYHVVPGKFDANSVMSMSSLPTAQGEKLTITTQNGKTMVGNDKGMATIIKTDVMASNGTIHWIDAVLMP